MKKNKKPWSTEKAMAQVYNENLWGKGNSKFYSGDGSHNPKIVEPYLKAVQKFLSSFDKKLSFLDLGCGDFNIGKQLVDFTSHYIAVDIVPSLIEYNTKTFQADNLEFRCLDIAKDALPKADIVIVRQVLQHLSNTEIQQILPKLYNYKYIILTEHLPKGNFEPNLDIISGQSTRLKKDSGVAIFENPFCFEAESVTELCAVEDLVFGGVLRSSLVEVF